MILKAGAKFHHGWVRLVLVFLVLQILKHHSNINCVSNEKIYLCFEPLIEVNKTSDLKHPLL